jgi:hypothetical protein
VDCLRSSDQLAYYQPMWVTYFHLGTLR